MWRDLLTSPIVWILHTARSLVGKGPRPQQEDSDADADGDADGDGGGGGGTTATATEAGNDVAGRGQDQEPTHAGESGKLRELEI